MPFKASWSNLGGTRWYLLMRRRRSVGAPRFLSPESWPSQPGPPFFARRGEMKRAALLLGACLLAGFSLSCAKEAPPERSKRVILIGIDGATWNRIDPLLQAGRMPHLQSIIEEGARAPLKSMLPSRSPALWTSVATGKNFDKHGINDFTAATGKDGEEIQRIMHMTSNMRRTKAL